MLLMPAVFLAGCSAGRQVIFVPSAGTDKDGKVILLRAGPDVRGHVFHWTGTEWELSRNAITVPEGWFMGSGDEVKK